MNTTRLARVAREALLLIRKFMGQGDSHRASEAALKAAVMVEDIARTAWLALQLGQPDEIPAEMIEKLHQRYQHEYGQ